MFDISHIIVIHPSSKSILAAEFSENNQQTITNNHSWFRLLMGVEVHLLAFIRQNRLILIVTGSVL